MSRTTIPDALRRQLRQQASPPLRCSYCYSQEEITGVALTVDHIIPELLGGPTELANLCLACWECNLRKAARVSGRDGLTQRQVRLYHPNRDEWDDHFAWSTDGIDVIGKTPIGRATVVALGLNRPALRRARAVWFTAGWHPPDA